METVLKCLNDAQVRCDRWSSHAAAGIYRVLLLIGIFLCLHLSGKF